MRWAGHVAKRARVPSEEHELGKTRRKKTTQGRLKYRWWIKVISDTTYMRTSAEVAVDRKKWRALVGAAKSQLGLK